MEKYAIEVYMYGAAHTSFYEVKAMNIDNLRKKLSSVYNDKKHQYSITVMKSALNGHLTPLGILEIQKVNRYPMWQPHKKNDWRIVDPDTGKLRQFD